MEFAVVSDTHWNEANHDLERLVHRLVGAKFILHAGDVVSPVVLEALGRVAPVLAVVGNCCHKDLRARLPSQLVQEFSGLKIGMTHGHLLDLRDGRSVLSHFDTEVKLVIHGHTHVPRLEIYDERWLFNPGSVSQPRYATPACYGWGSWSNGELKLEHKRF